MKTVLAWIGGAAVAWLIGVFIRDIIDRRADAAYVLRELQRVRGRKD